MMLEQLDVQPGQKILELGAGTGFNAGLLGYLVGETGHVTTIDVDEDIVAGARGGLAAAGIHNVEVILGDGAVGHTPNAPYDRIEATVGAHGVPHAWLDQLALADGSSPRCACAAASPARSPLRTRTEPGAASAVR